MTISSFTMEHSFLSNFYPCLIEFDGDRYGEKYCQKTNNFAEEIIKSIIEEMTVQIDRDIMKELFKINSNENK